MLIIFLELNIYMVSFNQTCKRFNLILIYIGVQTKSKQLLELQKNVKQNKIMLNAKRKSS